MWCGVVCGGDKSDKGPPSLPVVAKHAHMYIPQRGGRGPLVPLWDDVCVCVRCNQRRQGRGFTYLPHPFLSNAIAIQPHRTAPASRASPPGPPARARGARRRRRAGGGAAGVGATPNRPGGRAWGRGRGRGRLGCIPRCVFLREGAGGVFGVLVWDGGVKTQEAGGRPC